MGLSIEFRNLLFGGNLVFISWLLELEERNCPEAGFLNLVIFQQKIFRFLCKNSPKFNFLNKNSPKLKFLGKNPPEFNFL
jgi:hypothetical protein